MVFRLWSCPLGVHNLRSHRVVKGLLAEGYQHNNVAELMAQVCKAISSRVCGGAYAKMVDSLGKVWKNLMRWPKRKAGGKAEFANGEQGADGSPSARLDFDTILKHYRAHGARKTFLMQPCSKKLSTGATAKMVYVMPKYKLEYAWEKAAEMQCAMRLALAETGREVEAACAHPDTGAYDIFRHKKLRHRFVVVYVTTGMDVIDTHKHFIEGGGFTEHRQFVVGLHKKGFSQRDPKGPSELHSRSKKESQGQAKMVRSIGEDGGGSNVEATTAG